MSIDILSIVDSGQGTGLGHLKRTRNLVNGLRSQNGSVKPYYLLEKDFNKRLFPITEKSLTVDFHNGKKIFAAIDRLCPHPDVLIMDSYKIKEQGLNQLLKRYPSSVSLLIEDSNRFRRYNSDFLLNYNPIAHRFNYKTGSYLEKLFGLRYFPLSKTLKKARAKSRCRKTVTDILITMGGADPEDFTSRICRTFLTGFELVIFHIVLGPQFKNTSRILRDYKKEKHYRFYQNLNDLSQLMLKCDFAICAASTTAYELAYLGKPAILVQNLPNQALNLKFFKEHFLFPYLGLDCLKSRSKFQEKLRASFVEVAGDTKLREKTFEASGKFFNAGQERLMPQLLERLKIKKAMTQ